MNKQSLPIGNQYGISSLLLLIMIVLGVLIIWETNEFINYYPNLAKKALQAQLLEKQEPICLTGEPDDCNDSNDVFLLPE